MGRQAWPEVPPPPGVGKACHRPSHYIKRNANHCILQSLLNIIEQAEGLSALILELYGTGNPTAKGELLATLKKALDRGMLVVACTQCVKGYVNLHAYALGVARCIAP